MFLHHNFSSFHFSHKSRDSVVCIVTGYRLDDRGVRVRVPVFSAASRPAMGPTQHPIQWVPGVKGPGREADHSPPDSAEVKKMWVYTSTPHTSSWRSVQAVQHRDNFTSSLPHFRRNFFPFLLIPIPRPLSTSSIHVSL
jgi:hypothetical protein